QSVAEGLYYQGEALYARDKKQQAAAAYEQLVQKHPKSPLRPDALYALGVTRQDQGQVEPAAAAYELFLKEFPKHALGGEVVMRRAEAYFSQGQFDAAAQWFGRAAATPGFRLADLATLRQAASLVERKKLAEAAALYISIPTKFPQSSYRQAATLAA